MASYRHDPRPRFQKRLDRRHGGGKHRIPRSIRTKVRPAEPKQVLEMDPRLVCLQCPDQFSDIGEMAMHPHTTILLTKPWDGTPIYLSGVPEHPDDFFMSYVRWPGRLDSQSSLRVTI